MNSEWASSGHILCCIGGKKGLILTHHIRGCWSPERSPPAAALTDQIVVCRSMNTLSNYHVIENTLMKRIEVVSGRQSPVTRASLCWWQSQTPGSQLLRKSSSYHSPPCNVTTCTQVIMWEGGNKRSESTQNTLVIIIYPRLIFKYLVSKLSSHFYWLLTGRMAPPAGKVWYMT